MASSLTKIAATAVYADYWNRIQNMNPVDHNEAVYVSASTLLNDIMTCLVAINTDGAYNFIFTDPRYTITKYSDGIRPYKVRSGQPISYTFGKTGGETSVSPVTPVWTSTNLPYWVTLNSATGVLSGTAPTITATVFNILTGAGNLALSESYTSCMVSCKSAFGESTNGPLPFNIKTVHPTTSVVSSAATGGGVHAGALTTYNVTASNTPTSFIAYDLAQLNAGVGGTVAINPVTGAITGNCGSLTIATTYTINVAAINQYGEGEDKAVVITLT